MNNEIKNEINNFCKALDNLTEQTSITCISNTNSAVIKIIKYHLNISNRTYHLTITTSNNWEHEIQSFLEFINIQDAINDTTRQNNK